MSFGAPLLETLDRMGYGGILLDAAGAVLLINNTAKRILAERVSPEHNEFDLNWSRQALRSLLQAEGNRNIKTGQDTWAVIGRGGSARPVVVRSIPVTNDDATGAHKAMVLVDMNVIPRPTPDALQRVFGLTPCEARLGVELAEGKSPEEIAIIRKTTVGTVRRHLATVFSKTDTHRQSELVALLVHLAILP